MNLAVEPYARQQARWPRRGRVILASYDDRSVVVYQAYRPSLGRFASEHGSFGGEWSLDRMSWVKPGFLWMMYRCGWGTKEGQGTVLAVRIRRAFFDEILRQAVPSSFAAGPYETRERWQEALRASPVRLQWDPDHSPRGAPMERRAIQLGLSGPVLSRYARAEIVSIEDITPFVREQAGLRGDPRLLTPRETVYPCPDPDLRARILSDS